MSDGRNISPIDLFLASGVDHQLLLQMMDKHFNLEEIRTLAFGLRYDYDQLGGEGKTAKIRELILNLEREDSKRPLELVKLAADERPTGQWRDCLLLPKWWRFVSVLLAGDSASSPSPDAEQE